VGKHTEFPSFIDEPPIVSISGGVVFISYRASGARPERAMSLRTFERAIARGQRALERYAGRETDVIVDSD
jgi:hypothetical protein